MILFRMSSLSVEVYFICDASVGCGQGVLTSSEKSTFLCDTTIAGSGVREGSAVGVVVDSGDARVFFKRDRMPVAFRRRVFMNFDFWRIGAVVMDVGGRKSNAGVGLTGPCFSSAQRPAKSTNQPRAHPTGQIPTYHSRRCSACRPCWCCDRQILRVLRRFLLL